MVVAHTRGFPGLHQGLKHHKLILLDWVEVVVRLGSDEEELDKRVAERRGGVDIQQRRECGDVLAGDVLRQCLVSAVNFAEQFGSC